MNALFFPVDCDPAVAAAEKVGWPRWPWLVLLVVGVAEALWLAATPLRIAPASWGILIQSAIAAAAGYAAAVRLRGHARLFCLLAGIGFLAIAWPVLRLFNHLTMTIALPLADARLAAWDAAIGFDWFAYVGWVDRHPSLLKLMDASYGGLTGYTCIIFLLLVAGRDPAQRCFELIALFLVTAIICSTIGMFFPAAAAIVHYGAPADAFRNIAPLTGAYHLASLEDLRTNAAHMFDLRQLLGLVTFPSFHTAMGIVAIYCSRGTGWLFAPSLAVNLVMISSTPVFGSHYAIDLIGGAAVAAAAIAALRWGRRRGVAGLSSNNTYHIRPGWASFPSASAPPI